MKQRTVSRKAGRPRKSDNNSDMKEAILLASINLFGDRGFDGVSLSQIAALAKVDIGLIRYYFGSKAKLWEAAMGLLSEKFEGALRQYAVLGQGSQTDDLKAIIRAFIKASALWPQLSRILVFDGNNTNARGMYIGNNFVGPFFALLSTYITGAKAEGTVPNVSERTIFFMITHGGSFPMALPVLTHVIQGGDINSKEGLKAHTEAIIALIFD